MAEEEGAKPAAQETPEKQAQTPSATEEAPADKPLGEAGEKALDAFKQRAKDAEKRAKELEARVTEFEEKDKSELEKATSQRDGFKGERDAAKAESLRLRVALEKKLPPELIDRLKGNSKEELEADADELLKLVKPQEKSPDFDGGTREPAPETKTPEQAHGELIRTALGLSRNT